MYKESFIFNKFAIESDFIVVNYLFLALDKGNIFTFVLYYFSLAIDYSILVYSLHADFGFADAVLLFSSYLTDQSVDFLPAFLMNNKLINA